jgi:hypothetical protein
MLRSIARAEADGFALTAAQRHWLGMVSEFVPRGGYGGDSGSPPTWTGWYFDMFEDRDHGASASSSFVADYFTLTNIKQVAYVGADGPRLGVFIVDAGGAPRAMVGPVAKGYEIHAPIEARLNDEKARDPALREVSYWRTSFAVAEKPAPALGLEGTAIQCPPPGTASAGRAATAAPSPWPSRRGATGGPWRVAMRSEKPAGVVSVTLLDHHGDPISGDARLEVGREWRVAEIDVPPEVAASAQGVEALHVRVVDLSRSGMGEGPWDLTTSPSVYAGPDGDDSTSTFARRRGLGGFAIDGDRWP